MSSETGSITLYCIDDASSEWIASLAMLHGSLFTDGWPVEDFIRYINTKSDLVLVAVDEKHHILAGFLILRIVVDEAEILTIGVGQNFQGQGVASFLCEEMLITAKNRNVAKVFLDVREDNVEAQGLYEKQGFELVATRKGYYKNDTQPKRIDGLVMQKCI